MTAYQLFLLFLTLYILVLITTGLYFRPRQKTLTDFWLAGKRVGPLFIGFSAAASWLTAGALLAVVGFFMLLGIGSIWGFVAPNILALIVIGLLVKRIKKLPSITQPELLELRYGGGLRFPVAVIISVVMVLFAVADIKGFALVLQVFYGVDAFHAALIVGLAVALYVTLGGLSAVIATDTIQFIVLGSFVLIMAFLVASGASQATGMSLPQIASAAPASWWNPVSIGLPMVLIFIFAIIPGWISEQDPWQKVWAARDEKSARNGMFFGAFLVALVFGGCAVIALGLNTLYPEISGMGFPMGMAKAEPALLHFIAGGGFSNLVIALCSVALATAAMSCADTFATSGASCLARDVYQRYIHPGATMAEMQFANRIAVLLIITLATAGSFFINSIIEAIHVATFIASASYFFPLIGGIFWRRATNRGAIASMYTGFIAQVLFVLIDKINTPPMAPPYLESIHPLFMGHGVILAMALSGTVFFIVSLASNIAEEARLLPFFADMLPTRIALDGADDDKAFVPGAFTGDIRVNTAGSSARLHLESTIAPGIDWEIFVKYLSRQQNWTTLTGLDSVQRFDGLSGGRYVALTRGNSPTELWLELEGEIGEVEQLRNTLIQASREVEMTLGQLAGWTASEANTLQPKTDLKTAGAV